MSRTLVQMRRTLADVRRTLADVAEPITTSGRPARLKLIFSFEAQLRIVLRPIQERHQAPHQHQGHRLHLDRPADEIGSAFHRRRRTLAQTLLDLSADLARQLHVGPPPAGRPRRRA